MMKSLQIILSTLILSILIISLVSSIDSLDSAKQDLDKTVETAQDIKNKLENEDTRNEYLKKEWNKILQKTTFGTIVLNLTKVLETLNPIWQLILGVKFSWGAMFIYTLLIWLILSLFIYRALYFFNILTEKLKYPIILLSLGGIIIITLIRISKFLAFLLIQIITSLPHFVLQITGYVVVLVLLVYIMFNTRLVKYFIIKIIRERKIDRVIKKRENSDEYENSDEEVGKRFAEALGESIRKRRK